MQKRKNVLYVLNASANLFSINAITSNVYSVIFNDKCVNIQDKVSKNTVMTGYMSNKYVLDIHVVKLQKTAHLMAHYRYSMKDSTTKLSNM